MLTTLIFCYHKFIFVSINHIFVSILNAFKYEMKKHPMVLRATECFRFNLRNNLKLNANG
jgi:hypothetical protein